MAGSGGRSESSSNPERGLHPALSDPAKTNKVSHSRKLLCQSSQEQLPVGGITSAYRQEHSRTGPQSNISGVFQQTIFSPQTQQQMETYTRPEQTESLPQDGKIQNRDTGNHQDIPPTRGMGYLNRLQERLFPYSNTGTVQEISKILCPGSDIPIQSSAFRSVHSTLGVHCSSKGDETNGHTKGYKNPPIPRRLVGESLFPPGLSPTYSEFSENVSKAWLAGERGEIGAGAQTSLRFRRLPVQPQVRSGQTDTRLLAKASGLNTGNTVLTGLSGPAVYVSDRVTHGHRKTGSPRPPSHATHTMAPQKQLEGSRVTRKVIPIPRSLHPHLQWWLN